MLEMACVAGRLPTVKGTGLPTDRHTVAARIAHYRWSSCHARPLGQEVVRIPPWAPCLVETHATTLGPPVRPTVDGASTITPLPRGSVPSAAPA